MIVFIDIDGVIADCEHRLHYLEDKDYEKFYSEEEILKDQPIRAGIELFELLADSWQVELYVLTGRPYRTEKATRKWLNEHLPDWKDIPMLMRKDHDYRPSDVVKAEIIKKSLREEGSIIKDSDQEILLIDDDPKNVKGVEQACKKVKGIVFGSSRF